MGIKRNSTFTHKVVSFFLNKKKWQSYTRDIPWNKAQQNSTLNGISFLSKPFCSQSQSGYEVWSFLTWCYIICQVKACAHFVPHITYYFWIQEKANPLLVVAISMQRMSYIWLQFPTHMFSLCVCVHMCVFFKTQIWQNWPGGGDSSFCPL